MKNGRLLLSIAVAAAALFYTGADAIAADHEHTMKVGKTGEVTFNKETKVGDLALKPGRYLFQHRVEGTDHFVHFTEVTKPNPAYPTQPTAGQPKAHPGEVKCKLEPLGKKVSDTTLYLNEEGSGQRVVKAEVRGENVAHLF
jgi:hypothetical protein